MRFSWRAAQFNMLQLDLFEDAARIVEWKTKVLVHLPNACPDQAILRLVLERLPRLVISHLERCRCNYPPPSPGVGSLNPCADGSH